MSEPTVELDDVATLDDVGLPEDLRVRVPLAGKRVDLVALDQATGGHGLSASEWEVVAIEGSPVTEKVLAAAVAAAEEAPVPLTRAEMIDALPDPSKDFDGFKAGLRELLG